jgi:protein-tyrosine phosphatase
VAVQPTDPAGRTVPALPNARDLGGLPVGGGGWTGTGRVLRSAAPLLPEHAEAIATLGVARVVDLRGEMEVERQPNAAPQALVTRLDVLADAPQDAAAALAPLAASLAAPGEAGEMAAADVGALAVHLRDLMVDSYRDFVLLPSARAAAAGTIRAVLAADGPVLVHCTAGKDRTGWISAVLLDAAGVPWDVVLTDYLASAPAVEELFEPFRALMVDRGVDPALLDPLLGVEASWLDTARSTAVELHGSMDAYLTQGLGLSGDEVEALRVRLRS